jgi:nitrogen fixation protein FixH
MLIKYFKLFFRLTCHGYFCCAHMLWVCCMFFGVLVSFFVLCVTVLVVSCGGSVFI